MTATHLVWFNRLTGSQSSTNRKTCVIQFLNVCLFDNTAVEGSGMVGPVNQDDHTSWVAIVTPTDRPKSVHNRSVIEIFCCVFCCVVLPFCHFCGVCAFVIALIQISSFFSLKTST